MSLPVRSCDPSRPIRSHQPIHQSEATNFSIWAHITTTLDYKPQKIFPWVVQQVTENRREGDSDPDKALLAEVFKLLCNSAYSKLIETVERQTRVIYTKDQGKVDRAKRSVWFDDMEEIGDAFEIEFRKEKVTINRPF